LPYTLPHMDTPSGFNKRGLSGNERQQPIRESSHRPTSHHAARRSNGGHAPSGIMRVLGFIPAAGRWALHLYRRLGWKLFFLRVFGVFFGIGVLYLAVLWLSLPNVRDPKTFRADQSTVITDRNGVELFRVFADQDRTIIPADQIPKHMREAIIAIEDQRFYEHGCIDMRAIARAAVSQVIPGFLQSGGSTLAQQLALNALLKRERSITRKIREAMLACELERVYSKDEVLALYLNWVPFGPNEYGIEQASKKFFGKSAKDLSIAEAAVIASLPQRPTYLNPYGSHVRTNLTDDALQRINSGDITERDDIKSKDIIPGLLGNTFGTGATVMYIGGRSDQVLRNMQDQEYITDEQRLAALDELKSKVFKPARDSIRAPHFTLWVREQVETLFEETAEKGLLEQGGLTIQTTLDWKLQEIAERIINRRREDIASTYQAQNISLVALDPRTNEILAYVGNSNYNDEDHGGKIDMAQVPRQPGSSFKPLVYAAAFERGYGPGTIVYDVRTKFGPNEPQNFDGGFWGLTTIRRALAGSRNIPAIKAYYMGGAEDTILKFVSDLGAPTPLIQKQEGIVSDYGYTLAIGSAETPLIEMAQAYSTLADYGKQKPLQVFMKITDNNQALIPLGAAAQKPKEVLDPRIAYQITSILSDVGARPGEFWQSALTVPGYQAAAKTGTSNACIEWRDVSKGDCKTRKPNNLWTMGYTPNLVVGVWVGNANSSPLPDKADGLNVAAPIWKEFMVEAHKTMQNPVKNFEMPEGLVQPQVSLLSGELPTDCTPVSQRRSELFLKEKAPTKNDPGCVQTEVDKVTRLLASDSCPAEARETQSFLRPLNIEDSRISGTILSQWQEGIDNWVGSVRERGTGSILTVVPTEKCDISKTPGRLQQPTLEILVPVQGGIATYPALSPSLEIRVGSGVLSVQYELDGKPLLTVIAPPYDPVLRIPRSVEEGGTHTLTVTVTDTYYNQVTKEVTFRFEEDLEPPEVNFLIPSDDISIQKGATLRTQTRATDEGGIKYVEIYWDHILLTRLLRPPFTFEYPLTEATPGIHTLRAVGTDYGGNTDETSVRVTVEE